ncbi:COP9 signalosome complex subunit 4 [Coemansia sp. RSA 1939]|nr:COP9 signalosome complex subunit 4 [Coemansia sp. RSA 1939]KAJ2684661.1 COP9 signalosome complex subunit 4 [Coemansia sp. RSA 1285]
MTDLQQLASEISALFHSSTAGISPESTEVQAFVEKKLVEAKGTSQNVKGQQQQTQLKALKDMVDACLGNHMVQTTSTMFLSELVAMTESVLVLGTKTRKELLDYLLDRIQQRTSVYGDVIIKTRQALADLLVSKEQWEEAANMLQEIRFDQSQRPIEPRVRFETYVNTMELFLLANNPSQAAHTLIRATSLLNLVADVKSVLKYRYFQACILDHSHKYIEAANGYRNVFANYIDGVVEKKELILNKAIKCAVLASAGVLKVRVLASLYRIPELASRECFQLLEKMFLQQPIKPSEVEYFDKLLEEHQRQRTADGNSTLLEHAVHEHNVFVLSSLYTNIRFSNLGHMLGTSTNYAELICARMIGERRMKGHIDQTSGMITFEGAREVKEVTAAIFLKRQAASQPPPMHLREQVAVKWDERIVNLCTTVEDAVDMLIDRQPVYAKMLFRDMD